MSSRIKGITIEIAGDTVGLQKALKDVDKHTSSLQKELKDVERLLKFNPGNAEALAQKQKLLSEQVTVTTERLLKLQKAEKQVQEQFETGNISEEQYRAFRREIEFTQGSLEKLYTNLSDLKAEQEQVANSTEQLKTLFQATGTEVDDFADSLGSKLTNAIKEGTASSKQLEEAIQKIGQEALGASVDIDKLKQALASVDNGASLDQVKKDLDALSKEAGNAEQATNDLGGALEAVAGAAAAGGGIAGVIQTALDTSTLNTKIDITFEVPEKSKTAVKDAIYGIEAYGIDAEAALEGVRRQWALNKDASDETNAAVVKAAGVIAAVYGDIDFTELIDQNNKIAAGLGITNENAIALVNSLLKAGFPPGEIDIISEYGSQMKNAGFSVQQIQKIFENGIDLKNWSLDNLLDGIKEGRIQITSFGQEVPKALGDLLTQAGMSTAQFQAWGKAVADGGENGAKAMSEMITWLDGVQDKSLKNALATQIMATMWEDSGQNMISVFQGVGDATDKTKQNTDQLNASVAQMDATPAVQMKDALFDMQTAMAPLLAIIAELIAKIAEWMSNNPTLTATIMAIITALGILIGICMALAPIFITLSGAAAALGVSIGAVTWPVLAVVAAIAAVIAIGVAVYKNWDTLKSGASSLIDRLGPLAPLLLGLLGPFGLVVGAGIALYKNWDTLMKEAGELRDKVANLFKGIDWKLPDVKLPHFRISGDFDLVPPGISVPSINVDWYRDGGLFPANSPRLIGIGDANVPEAALPLSDKVLGTIANMISDRMDTGSGNGIVIQQMIVREESDIHKIARELYALNKMSGRRVGIT